MRSRTAITALVIAVVALACTACGGDNTTPADVPDTVATPPDAKAVALRGDIASLLEEHVFLIADTVRSGTRAGFDSELYAAGKEELERSSDKLVTKLSSLFTPPRREEFARRLSELVDLSLAYGREQVQPGAAERPLRRRIDETRVALETVLVDASTAVSAEDIDDHLELTVDELLLALDRLAGDAAGQVAHTASAAHRSRGLAGVLAAAVAEESTEIAGSAVSETARLHADVRTLLEEDVHLSFGALQVGLAVGFDSPVFTTASRQVDESATAFADRLATIPDLGGGELTIPAVDDPTDDIPDAGSEQGVTVSHHRAARDLLRKHWQLLQLYAREVGPGAPGLTRKEIEKRLHDTTTIFADVLADQTGLPTTPLLEPLEEADKALTKAIEALVKEDPKAYTHLAKAVEHTADAADVLTDGVIRVQIER